LREVYKVRSGDGEIFDLAIDLAGTSIFTGAEKGVARKWSIRWNYEALRTTRDASSLLTSLNEMYWNAGRTTEQDLSFLSYGRKDFDAEKGRNVNKNFPPSVWEKSRAEAKYCGFVELD